jgi:hypothetical protein
MREKRMTDEILSIALTLHARGFSLFPIPYPVPGTPKNRPGDGKTPAAGLGWKQYQRWRASEAQLRTWFGGAPRNIAIITGAISGIDVVDADSPETLRRCTAHLPYTPWQVKTARGYHLYYRHPGVHVGNRARLDSRYGRLAIDVRGDGGYVIGPGSMHASGHVYAEAGDASSDQVPVFSLGWLERSTRGLPIITGVPCQVAPAYGAPVHERARRYLASIPLPEIGFGSDERTLYAAARLVRGFALDEASAINLLWEWAGARPGWTREWIAEKVRHAAKYGSEPIGALR